LGFGIWDLGFGIWDLTNSALHQQVRRTIRKYGLCPPGARVLVALSGGSDSVALTLLLRDLAAAGGFQVVALAHFNHRLRDSACRDEQFCREFAGRHGIPLVIDSIDVRGYAAGQGLSLEDAARRVRYDFLDRAAVQAGADHIAVGHTQDDQAETFLLKVMRGAGLTGLGAIYPRRGAVIRPLLETSRADLQGFLKDRGEDWVEDETNTDEENPRNRLRHRVIPDLDRAYGGPTRASLARAAALIREDAQWLDEQADAKFNELTVIGNPASTDIAQYGGSQVAEPSTVARPLAGLGESAVAKTSLGPGARVELDVTGLAALPPPLRRRVLLRALRACADQREIGLVHIETALEVLDGTRGGADIPGGRMELRRGKLVLLKQGAF
jgi:tRNA(Ile)-lysidine synthetase-like protein